MTLPGQSRYYCVLHSMYYGLGNIRTKNWIGNNQNLWNKEALLKIENQNHSSLYDAHTCTRVQVFSPTFLQVAAKFESFFFNN